MSYPISNRTVSRRHSFSIALAIVVTTLAVVPQNLSASRLRENAFVTAVRKARASVVNIHGRKQITTPTGGNGETVRSVNGMGTGVIIDPRGYIITNYHVVEGVSRIEVTLDDHRAISARLISHDLRSDLAVIKINVAEDLPVISIGTSSDLMPGEDVMAIGNAFGYEHTVTRGIISGLHRDVPVSDTQNYDDVIQIDSSINPGNSGGPLLNIDGEMIGINVAVRVGAQGIGFTIPVDQAMKVAARLIAVDRHASLWHGATGETQISEFGDPSQFVVESVKKGSPADKGDLRSGDIVVSVGSILVERALDFERGMIERSPGEEVPIEILRDGETIDLSLVLAAKPRPQPSTAERVWQQLGLRLDPASKARMRSLSGVYKGGLRVLEVRSRSSADRNGLKRGDIVVGMEPVTVTSGWKTEELQHVAWVLDFVQNQTEQDKRKPIKVYLLRSGSGSTLFAANLKLAELSDRTASRN